MKTKQLILCLTMLFTFNVFANESDITPDTIFWTNFLNRTNSPQAFETRQTPSGCGLNYQTLVVAQVSSGILRRFDRFRYYDLSVGSTDPCRDYAEYSRSSLNDYIKATFDNGVELTRIGKKIDCPKDLCGLTQTSVLSSLNLMVPNTSVMIQTIQFFDEGYVAFGGERAECLGPAKHARPCTRIADSGYVLKLITNTGDLKKDFFNSLSYYANTFHAELDEKEL